MLKQNYLGTLAVITGINVLVLLVRNLVVENHFYNFLLWNLFLGFVPLIIAWLLSYFSNKAGKILLVLGSLVWLLFYPNAPYMISDLIHVNKDSPIVLYDTMIIFSFAMLSLFYGFYSLKLIHGLYKKISNTTMAHTVITVTILLSSFGFYLGRILRLNSWDIFTKPLEVLQMVLEHLFPVHKNPVTYVVVFLFSAVQIMLLNMIRDLDEVESTG